MFRIIDSRHFWGLKFTLAICIKYKTMKDFGLFSLFFMVKYFFGTCFALLILQINYLYFIVIYHIQK